MKLYLCAALACLLPCGQALAVPILVTPPRAGGDGATIPSITGTTPACGTGSASAARACDSTTVLPSGTTAGAAMSMTTGAIAARALADRGADVFNVKDYCPITNTCGTNGTATVGSLYRSVTTPAQLATAIGMSWPTNPLYGLTFTMTLVSAQRAAGTTLNFLATGVGSASTVGMYDANNPTGATISTTGTYVLGWVANMAQWDDPANHYMNLYSGMQLTTNNACMIGTTTIASAGVGNIQGGTTAGGARYGTIVLSRATASACPLGTVFKVTLSPAQMTFLTQDYVAIQSAVAAAGSAIQGGRVVIPHGLYNLSHEINLNLGAVSNDSPTVDFGGDNENATVLYFTNDLGISHCSISGTRRDRGSYTKYHDFTLARPNFTATNGTHVLGMEGLCVATQEDVRNVQALNFRAGLGVSGNHIQIHSIYGGGSEIGLRFDDFSSTSGGVNIDSSNLSGNSIANISVSTTNANDSNVFNTGYVGITPYVLFLEPAPSNVTIPVADLLTNSAWDHVYPEALGNGFIYGASASCVMSYNIITGGNSTYQASSFQIRGTPASYFVYCNTIQNNTFIGTSWGSATGWVTVAAIQGNGVVTGNEWINDQGFPTSGTSTIPTLAGAIQNNTFKNALGSGVWKSMGNYSGNNAGTPVQPIYGLGSSVSPYYSGPLAGVLASSATPNEPVAIYTQASGLIVTKTLTSQSIVSGQPLFASNGGFEGGISNASAAGVANQPSASASTVLYLDLEPISQGGESPPATELTATGTSSSGGYAITAQTSVFSVVASGTAAILSTFIPLGSSEIIINHGANPLAVCPGSGNTIGTASAGTCASLAAGAVGMYVKQSATGFN